MNIPRSTYFCLNNAVGLGLVQGAGMSGAGECPDCNGGMRGRAKKTEPLLAEWLCFFVPCMKLAISDARQTNLT